MVNILQAIDEARMRWKEKKKHGRWVVKGKKRTEKGGMRRKGGVVKGKTGRRGHCGA